MNTFEIIYPAFFLNIYFISLSFMNLAKSFLKAGEDFFREYGDDNKVI